MSNTNKEVSKEIQQALGSHEHIPFEPLQAEQSSPLNEPVVQKEEENHIAEGSKEPDFAWDGSSEDVENQTDDAPEQDIHADYSEDPSKDAEEAFELPVSHAKQAADAILGMTDNVLEVGGGYFVKIKKHKAFYEFEEIIEVIDGQNEKNVRRIKLDPEDKLLLRPILITILRKKAKKITPEQQLLGAVVSILMKKGQAVLEIKAENEVLVGRILEIVGEEKSATAHEEGKQDASEQEQPEYDQEEAPEQEHDKNSGEEIIYEPVIDQYPSQGSIDPQQVLEVAEELAIPDEKPEK